MMEDRAAYHRAHRDSEQWEEASPPDHASRRRNLAATVTVRFAASDAEAIRALAKRRNVGYSDIVREAVRAYVHPQFRFDASQSGGMLRLGEPPETGIKFVPSGANSRSFTGRPTTPVAA
jgi:hypothetical protein